jgi:hypothetical protein
MAARRALGIRGMVSYAIITQLRGTALAVTAASMVMLLASLANRLSPAGFAPKAIDGAIHWSGWMAGVPEGTYTFGVPPAGVARLAIDGRLVADGTTSASIHLDPSLHAFDFEDRRTRSEARGPDSATPPVTWSRAGSEPSAVPRSVLFSRRPKPLTLAVVSALRFTEAASQWLWVITLVASVAVLELAAWVSIRASIAAEVDWLRLRWIVMGSLLLNLVPIWWGLPAIWPPDELTPTTWMRGLEAHFSNGWFDRWPPFHYYVLTAANAPVLLLNAFGRINFSTPPWPQVLTLVDRSVSVVLAAGTLIAVAVVAARMFGRRAGLFAAAVFALAVPFPYYAKTANLDVPYVFWFAVSLVFFFPLLERLRVRDAVWFGAAAALAICTKDQAYALYPLMLLAIAVCAWRASRIAPLVVGGTIAAAMFAVCHNLLFNWDGFVSHVRFIAGPGNENYRVFAPTLGGRLELLRLTSTLIKDSWGWPLTIVCAAGVVHAVAVRRCRPALILLAPAISYYIGFLDVILYNYDRFLLPVTLILSMFGGYAIDRWIGTGMRSWRAGAIGVMFAYSVLYAATIDALMLRDSRYVVARWASEQLQPGEMVAISGPHELEPTFTVPYLDIATRADLERAQPAYYVLSADYAVAAPLDTEWGQLVAALRGGTADYGLIARVRCPSPWPWLPDAHPELIGPRQMSSRVGAVSVLRDINPTLEIYAHGSRPRANVSCAATLLP